MEINIIYSVLIVYKWNDTFHEDIKYQSLNLVKATDYFNNYQFTEQDITKYIIKSNLDVEISDGLVNETLIIQEQNIHFNPTKHH